MLPQRALTLLLAAGADTPERLAQFRVGQRDERLLTLREWAFGPHLNCVADCPACGETLEFESTVSDVRMATASQPAEDFSLAAMGYEIRFRLPVCSDIDCLRMEDGISANHLRLLNRCVLSAQSESSEIAVDCLPESVTDAISKRMAEADAQADVRIALTCPACTHGWAVAFDITSFFWTEITVWAMRMLREIHLIASEYGWSEIEILSLNPARRQAYLEMIGA